MTIKFNDTQLMLLSAALQRDDRYLVPPPYAKRGQAQRAAAKLLEAGLIKEIKAKAGVPVWRRDEETGQLYSLKLSATGAKAIAVSEETPPGGDREQRSDNPTDRVDANPDGSQSLAPIDVGASPVAPTPTAPRGGTKIAQLIERRCHGVGGLVAEEHDENQLLRISVPSGDHSPGDLALSPVHA